LYIKLRTQHHLILGWRVAKGFNDPRYRDLIGLLIDERKLQNLRQVDVADRLGQHQQYVSRYESGQRRLDVVELADVVQALGLDLPTLVATIKPSKAADDAIATRTIR
jgi:transcriptional regulator with XRE-family HTH domain